MTFTLFILCICFGTVQVVTGVEVFDSSNYKVLSDPILGNYTYYAAKCTGKLSYKVRSSLVNIHIQLSSRKFKLKLMKY